MHKRLVYIILTTILILCLANGCGKGANGGEEAGGTDSTITTEETAEAVQDSHVEVVHVDATPLDYVAEGEAPLNPCVSLNVPTQITRVGEFYFLVDCYNNQVLYSRTLDCDVTEWFVMTPDIKMGHTVASDGQVYLIDDTENHRVLVFERINNRFVNTQVFDGVGTRPHYIVYNEQDGLFYTWSSMTGQMYVMEHDADSTQMYISRIMTIDELSGVYVRSFTIDGDSIYLVSGPGEIIEASVSDFSIKNRFPVPDSMAGMIQIMPVNKGFYITISTDAAGNQDYATMIFTKSLDDLAKGDYTDIYSSFIGGGTPYYMGYMDDRYFLTEHRLVGHSVWSFDIDDDGMPVDVQALY